MLNAQLDTEWVFNRYEQVRPRLPSASFPERSVTSGSLLDLIDSFDVFVFDAFGVLNVGEAAIPGAAERVRQLGEQGKCCFILTNSATFDRPGTAGKFANLGFEIEAGQIISSRDILIEALGGMQSSAAWGLAAPAAANPATLGVETSLLGDNDAAYENADGFILLSSHDWSPARQDRLAAALSRRPRPVLVGNPDLVAPRQGFLSLEPGYYAHDLADRTGIAPEFFGKPFPNAFKSIVRRFPSGLDSLQRRRIAMVGDTLHTDILGGAAAGFSTVLVTEYGVLRGRDAGEFIGRSGIVPDYIIPAI